MNANYETEQADLREDFENLQKEISQNEENGVNLERFISIVEKYSHLEKLTVEIANELVERILVHPAQGRGKTATRKIEVYYNFIGKIKNE